MTLYEFSIHALLVLNKCGDSIFLNVYFILFLFIFIVLRVVLGSQQN